MEQKAERDLRSGEPSVGDALVFDGLEWKVIGASIYRSDAGYRVHEWQCETGGNSASLLKEEDPKQGVRWFFTRAIPEDAVALEDGETLEAWMERTPDPKQPPAVLTYHQTTYRYEGTTEGTHEDASGERAQKITWDYWDAGHAHNLAVELWPGGEFECYLGVYVQPDQVAIRRGGAAAQQGSRPFLVAAVFFLGGFFVAFMVDRPFDQCLATALSVAALGTWVVVLTEAPLTALGAFFLSGVLSIIFWQFPPLTSGVGIAAILGTPLAIGLWARSRETPEPRRGVLYAACFSVFAPLLLMGLYYYFTFAPGPHTVDQLALALGPAALGALAARVIAGFTFRASAEQTS